jgi:hypothetical protein
MDDGVVRNKDPVLRSLGIKKKYPTHIATKISHNLQIGILSAIERRAL